MEDFVMPTPEEMEASRLQMCQQGAGGPGAKPADGKIVTRRTAAGYKQKRAKKGTKRTSTIVTPGKGSDTRSAARRKADHFAKKQAGLARVKKGYTQRPLSRGKVSRLPQLSAGTAPAKKSRAKKSTTAAKKPAAKKSTGGRKKAAAGANPFDASGI